MKKALVAAILGIALNVTSSHAQGYIIMQSYDLVGSTPIFSGVTYGAGSGAKTGQYVGAAQGWKADLMFSLNGGTTYSLAAGSQTTFYVNAGVQSQDGGSPTSDGAGVFIGPTVTIPGYTSGSVSFIVEAFNGTSYSSGNTTFHGQSAAFAINGLQTNPGLPAGTLLNNAGTTVNGLQPFSVVAAVPEPTVFALAGIGAAALMIVRRKK